MRDATLFGEHIHVLVDEQCPPEKWSAHLTWRTLPRFVPSSHRWKIVFVTLTASADQRRVRNEPAPETIRVDSSVGDRIANESTGQKYSGNATTLDTPLKTTLNSKGLAIPCRA